MIPGLLCLQKAQTESEGYSSVSPMVRTQTSFSQP